MTGSLLYFAHTHNKSEFSERHMIYMIVCALHIPGMFYAAEHFRGLHVPDHPGSVSGPGPAPPGQSQVTGRPWRRLQVWGNPLWMDGTCGLDLARRYHMCTCDSEKHTFQLYSQFLQRQRTKTSLHLFLLFPVPSQHPGPSAPWYMFSSVCLWSRSSSHSTAPFQLVKGASLMCSHYVCAASFLSPNRDPCLSTRPTPKSPVVLVYLSATARQMK